jgi:hypothetical protein
MNELLNTNIYAQGCVSVLAIFLVCFCVVGFGHIIASAIGVWLDWMGD